MELVPVRGLEPPWGYPRLILSQMRIPFRHTGSGREVYPKWAWVCMGSACGLL
jgi:hypothetical protein